jgi:hypothetical protein
MCLGSGSGSGAGPASADVARLSDQRATEVKDALARASALMNASQQDAAKKLLAEHDVDVETGSTAPRTAVPSEEGSAGEPVEAEP